MNDKEFEELKRKVVEEEQRRKRLREQKEYLEYLKNGFDLQKPNGWCRNMKIKIIQDVEVSMSVDGNGDYRHEHNEKDLTENECELLFEAFKQMASLYEKNINSLECDGGGRIMNTDLEDIILYLNANEPTGKFAKQIERLKLIVEAFDILSLAYGEVYDIYKDCGEYVIEDCSDGYKQFYISDEQAITLLKALELYKQKHKINEEIKND